jgi:hypothetical protein
MVRKRIKKVGDTFVWLLKNRTKSTFVFLFLMALLTFFFVKSISCNRDGLKVETRDKPLGQVKR